MLAKRGFSTSARSPPACLGPFLLGPACVGAPEPVPIPAPSSQLLRASSVSPDGTEAPILLLGLPGAVTRSGRVVVQRGAQRQETRSTAAGSFGLELLARRGDELAVSFEDSAPTPYRVQPITGFYGPTPHPIAGIPPLVGPTAGTVTVRGESEANRSTLGVNLDNGEVSSVTADAAGGFSLQLGADHGHQLRIFIDETPLGTAWELTVP